jgi:hypothetical protein
VGVDGSDSRRPVAAERNIEVSPSDRPLEAVLGVAESLARRHGGELRLRSGGDGRFLVELRFTLPSGKA